MKLTLYGFDVFRAIQDYVNETYGVDFEEKCYIEQISLSTNHDIISYGAKNRYKDDGKWEDDKYIKTAEYEIEGVYLKRRKKGSKKSQYVKLSSNDIDSGEIGEDTDIDLWIAEQY